MRLNIPAGTAVRFEPGDAKRVSLVEFAGARRVFGLNGLTEGADRAEALRRLRGVGGAGMSLRLGRHQHADLYGPTTGDRVRLADTDLLIRIERDLTVPGDEVKFGGGKVIRDGMGQSARATRAEGALDTVITNAVIVDHWGIVKADIGIRDGRIVGIGKAGNPDLMDGVTPGMVIGAGTEVIAGEGRIVTAGGIDAHVHLICPQLVAEAISAGLTTMIGGGTGPATGTARHHLHARGVAHPPDAGGRRGLSRSTWASSARATPRASIRCASRSPPGPSGSSCTRTGERRRRPSTAPCAWPTSTTSRWPSTPTPSTRRASWRTRSAPSAGGRSTPITPRARAAGTPPTSSACAASRTACPRPPTPRCPSR